MTRGIAHCTGVHKTIDRIRNLGQCLSDKKVAVRRQSVTSIQHNIRGFFNQPDTILTPHIHLAANREKKKTVSPLTSLSQTLAQVRNREERREREMM